jgi:hypothetical protein
MQFSLPLDGSYFNTFVYATTALVTVEEPLILQQPFQMDNISIVVVVVVEASMQWRFWKNSTDILPPPSSGIMSPNCSSF